MKRTEFSFQLPDDLIAQFPLKRRDHSRLMVVERETGGLNEVRFLDFPGFCRPGDLLVLNNSRVFPARLDAVRKTGGHVELLLLCPVVTGGDTPPAENTAPDDRCTWEALLKPAKRIREGEAIFLSDKTPVLVTGRKTGGMSRIVRFPPGTAPLQLAEKLGKTPLPPYIRREATSEDRLRYQTVYADENGSTAAPTAGLHFTEAVLDRLRSKGVVIEFITLHVGPGTFLPVRTEEIEDHPIHAEYCKVPASLADTIVKTKERGNRVIAVGTTATRALETAFSSGDPLEGYEGWTKLFIYPPYEFKAVDALLTNFHLPESSLLMLVSAFAGKELIFKAYDRAIREKFRFYSYGDCMLIL